MVRACIRGMLAPLAVKRKCGAAESTSSVPDPPPLIPVQRDLFSPRPVFLQEVLGVHVELERLREGGK